MKHLFILLFVAMSCKPKAQDASVPLPNIDSIMSHYSEAGMFGGVALVAQNGKIVFSKGYGWADAQAKKPNDTSMVFQIGSVTKQFTAVAILKLQEEGKLSVNDTISKYFPQIQHAKRITIHHLLTHTSGLYNYTNDTIFWLHEIERPSSQRQMIARFANQPLDFEPGTKFSYSNSGYVLLGYIIEKASGKPYEQYLRETIFRPLGMNRSGFDFTKAANRATGYYVGDDLSKAAIVDSTGSYAAGAIYSTVNDLYKWVQAIHNKKILTPVSWEKATTPFKSQYAYGLIADKLYGQQRIWHNGGIHGFVSHVDYYPETNSAVILLSNYMQSDLMKLSNTLSAALAGKSYKLPPLRKEVKLPDSTLQQYVGAYPLSPQFIVTVTLENGKLMAQATGQGAYEIYAEKPDHFFYKVVDAQVVFHRDTQGKVTAMVLHQNGTKLRGEKNPL
jgi:CubicO group peptidase (beta-lactamase class C family)